MRILVAHNVPCAHRGGMARLMEYLHAPLRRAGHTVDFLCAEDAPPRARGAWGRFAFPLLVRRAAVRAARTGLPYDVVNVHEPTAAAIATFRRAAGDPAIVVTTHGVEQRAWELALQERRLGREGPRARTRVIYPLTSLWQCRVGLRRADHVFCLNEEDRDYLATRFGVSRARITRVFPGADPLYAEAAGERTYQGARHLLFAGTWRKNKGIEDLVPAVVRLADAWPDLTLTVLGPGVAEETVRAAFPERTAQRVRAAQTASETENARAFAAADLFVLPSLFEGTPLTLIEAMMSGLPIVTTNTCGMRDVVEHGRTGLLVPTRRPDAVAGAVERLLRDRAERAALGRAARAEALARYTWDRVAAPVADAYERLLRRSAA